jgi:Ca2+-transporting ATPase
MSQDSGQPWIRSASEILDELNVSGESGLSQKEARNRLREHGPNRLEEAEARSGWAIFIDQFKSIIIGILAVAAVLSFSFGEWVEGIAVMVAIIINTVIGFFSEFRAVRSMEALRNLSRTTARVRREGEVREIAADGLVPGDVVVLESGDMAPADIRLIEASKMQVDESSLTGESLPVSKMTDPIDDPERPLAERGNMLYKGTALTRGAGHGVVVATGMKTELGNISAMAKEAGAEQQTPLEKRLARLGRRLVWLTIGVAALVALSGIVAGRDFRLMIEVAIALAVAAVPEGLPIVATVALARGMWRMARRNAVIRKLAAVETLGATSVICTDKTGTLTENQMTLRRIALPSGDYEITGEGLSTDGEFRKNGSEVNPGDDEFLQQMLEVGVLCTNASLGDPDDEENNHSGDPMEIALLVAGAKAGMRYGDLLERMPEVREEAFDPDVKMMATFHESEGGRYRVAVKGAPSRVMRACPRLGGENGGKTLDDEVRRQWNERADVLAGEGLRVLALAEKYTDDQEANPYDDLVFLGVIGLLDPPRQSVRPAIDECQEAGIRVVMVTGDQAITARKVGAAVGLADNENETVVQGKDVKAADEISDKDRRRILQASVLARVSPEQKLNLIDLHRKNRAVVAMTGDGVNDAPALEKADIGIAMGQRGTEVAREAADMVLRDDAFSTIVAAVEQGRAIFNNIRAFTLYLLSGNMGEIIAVGLASTFGFALPLLPLQILYINVVNDAFPALALGMGRGSRNLMNKPPRDPDESLLTNTHWSAIAAYGLLIAATILGAYALGRFWLGLEQTQAVTISFLTLGFARLWHVFNMRHNDSGFWRNEITRNPYVWAALLLCTGLLLIAAYLPGLSDALRVETSGLRGWGLILGMSLVPLIVGQSVKAVVGKMRR